MKHPDTIVLIFSKAPVVGQVKTRLVPYISAEQAARLHAELTHDRLQMCTAAALCDVELWCSPDSQHPFFIDCVRRYGIRSRTQAGDDLGERMANAIRRRLVHYSKIIIIGADAPALQSDTLESVIAALDDAEVVLVPAEDGGYVLLGATRYREGMLASVPWGSERVLASTVRNLERLQMQHRLVGECWDVDRPEDLVRYKALKM